MIEDEHLQSLRFVESGGEKAIITSIESATSSLHGAGGKQFIDKRPRYNAFSEIHEER